MNTRCGSAPDCSWRDSVSRVPTPSARARDSSEWRTVATIAIAPTIVAIAKTAVATNVMRTRTEPKRRCSVLPIGRQPVAGAAHRDERARPERVVDLAPQVARVHLDDVGVAGEVGPPD